MVFGKSTQARRPHCQVAAGSTLGGHVFSLEAPPTASWRTGGEHRVPARNREASAGKRPLPSTEVSVEGEPSIDKQAVWPHNDVSGLMPHRSSSLRVNACENKQTQSVSPVHG